MSRLLTIRTFKVQKTTRGYINKIAGFIAAGRINNEPLETLIMKFYGLYDDYINRNTTDREVTIEDIDKAELDVIEKFNSVLKNKK